MKKLLLSLLLLAPLALPAAIDKEKTKKEVAAMEDAFCAMAAEKGLLAAFEHFAAPDVAFVDTDPRKFRGLEAGDLIGIKCSGAYGPTASPIHFISHAPPKEIVVETVGGTVLIEDSSQFGRRRDAATERVGR